MSDENGIADQSPAEEPAQAPVETLVEAPEPSVDETAAATPVEQPTVVETAKPKKRRWWVVVVLVVVLAGAAVGGYYSYQLTQTRNAASDKIADATRLIENADMVVLDVDEVVRAEITAEVGQQAVELQDRVAPAVDDLTEAIILIDEATPDLAEEDVPHADALKESAQARADMLGSVDPILEGNAKAGAALQPSLDAWSAVLEGESLADQAIAEYNKLTTEGVKRSQTLTEDALAKFESGKDLFSTAATSFPEADFSLYVTYVDGKIELLGISKQANAAFLAGDKAKANELSNQYNTKDKALVEQAGKLPATPAEVVASAYEELAGEATATYFEARERATQADARLNDLES